MEIKEKSGLQISEDYRHQKMEWRVEHIGWFAIGIFLLAGLLGLLGPGLLSERKISTGEIFVKYQKFNRYQSPSVIKIYAGSGIRRDDTLRISLSREFLDGVELRTITPEPLYSSVGEKFITYKFISPRTAKKAELALMFNGDKYGSMPCTLKIDDKQEISFSLFFYP